MTALQAVALAVVAITGTAVVLTPVPIRQALVLAIYGFTLTALFFSFQAPDVALSELVVSGVALPVIILSALRRITEESERQAQSSSDGRDDDDRSRSRDA